MSDYYTRTGDDGTTGLLGEGRVPKHHPIPEAVGTIDEATAALGLARSLTGDPDTAALILQVQRDLYHLMAEISATPENAARFRVIDGSRVAWLEDKIEIFGKRADHPGEFIIPGDSTAGAALALARTVIRRAERRVAALYSENNLENHALLHYLNRLSSLCFLLELIEISSSGLEKPTLARSE
jgi:cob(I)alamin adenosyltransferase